MAETIEAIGGLTGILTIIVFIFILGFIWRSLTQKQDTDISRVIASLIQIIQAQQEDSKSHVQKLYEVQQNSQATLIEILRTQQTMLMMTTNVDPEVFEIINRLSDRQLKQLIEQAKELD